MRRPVLLANCGTLEELPWDFEQEEQDARDAYYDKILKK